MEAYFATLRSSGASDFLIIRDDAAITASPSRKKTLRQRSSSSAESSSSYNPCMGPPKLPQRKRSCEDITSISKGRISAAEKAANARVLNSFLDEVMGPAASSKMCNRKGTDYIEDALKITNSTLTSSPRKSTRWDAGSDPSDSLAQ